MAFDFKALDAWMMTPVWGQAIFTRSRFVFVALLLAIRYLPRAVRNPALLLLSLVIITRTTSIFYASLFLSFSVLLYLGCSYLQGCQRKRFYSYVFSGSLVLLFFLFMNWKGLASPWTGSLVHQFGIAYALFRFLYVILDVGRGTLLPADPLEFFVYAFFLPTFFQGPIERLSEFSGNLREETRPRISWQSTGWNMLRMAGAFLKVWAATRFFDLDWKVYFDYPQGLSYGFLWWGMYARAISFYLFVSAANDLTIASSAMAGYHIHENYHHPYFKRNLAEFWRSWHMTLFRFLKDYVYIPLGGNRRHVYWNILVVFMAVAMWHVTSWAFVIWGLWHGIGMCLLRVWQNYWKSMETASSGVARGLQLWGRGHPRLVGFASMVFTFHFVAIGWLPFWGGHPQGLSMILRLISGNHWKLFVWE